MASLNKVILVGRLTRDPELRHTASGLAIATFTLAVDRRFKNQQGEKQTDFFRCTAWRQRAEFVSSYVTKGRLVAVEGSVEINEVVGQDGQKRYFTDIVCDSITTLDSARSYEESGGAPGGPAAGGGYFQDEELAAPQQQQQQQYSTPQPAAPAQSQPAQGSGGWQTPPQSQPQQSQPAYPDDDYDDSDPFADE